LLLRRIGVKVLQQVGFKEDQAPAGSVGFDLAQADALLDGVLVQAEEGGGFR
jgi:hypothetical protein